MEKAKKKTAKQRYSVNVYLGKELHAELSNMAKFMGLSLSQVVSVLLHTGVEFSTMIENNVKNGGATDAR